MGTVIDSLVIELGLDPSKFTKGQKEAFDSLKQLENEARKRGGQVEKSAQGIEQAFGAVQKRLLGVAGLMLGGLGIEQFIQRMTKLQVTTENVARVFGLSSQSMQRWGAVGERFGISGSAVQQGMQQLQQQRYNMMNFGDPGGLMRMAWGTAGSKNPLQVQAPNGQMLPAEQLMMNISKWLQKAGPQGANALMSMGGLSSEFVQLLMNPPDKLKKLLEESKKLAPTDAEIARFKELNDAFEKASQLSTRLATALTAMLAPSLVEGFEEFSGHVVTTLRTLKLIGEGKYGQAIENELKGPQGMLKSREERLGVVERGIAAAKERGMQAGVDALEGERKQLIEEIRKLREELQKGASVHKESFIGGFGAGGDNVRAINAAFSGAIGGGPNYGSGTGASRMGGGGLGQPMGTGTTVRPGGPGANLDNLPAASDEALAASRQRFADELRKKPWLAEKIMAISLGENKTARANQAVIESMMNRAAVRGTSLEEAAKLYGKERGGYYAGYDPGSLHNPKYRSLAEKSLRAALAGGNAAVYATDNASGGLAQRDVASGRFQDLWVSPNGEHFSRRMSEAGKYAQWRKSLGGLKSGTAGIPLPRARPSQSDDLRTMLDSNSRFADSRSVHHSSMSIGDVHVHTQATDAEGIASAIRPNLQRFAKIASANYGPA